ncbi:MAG: DNA alkylation repair protein [Lachnospiraceae bacterium]|nr:DNA alkylation repair protein [Lachnospiraceae bacterium]
MKLQDIRDEIATLADPKNAEFFLKLNPTAKLPCAGVRIPQMRKLAQKIAKDDYRSFLDNNPMDTFEMECLQAFVIGYAKDDINVILGYLDAFIPKVHDWSVSDSLCQTFKIAKKYPAETYAVLSKYKDSKREFEVRIVAIMLMSQFLNDEYIDTVIEVINSLYTEDFYAKMGVAWAVATIMAKYPDKCLDYMLSPDNRLDDWTYKKALQKMKESYRVDNEIVERIIKARS